MPYKSKRNCKYSYCSDFADNNSPYCKIHKQEIDRLRRSAYERGYTQAWREARKRYLRLHPLCVECQKKGKLVQAEVVDHIEPHKGETEAFWDENNWQSLCLKHHSKKTGKGK